MRWARLCNRLSEYIRLAASGETILVADRDQVVAELGPPRETRSPILADAFLANAVRSGVLTPPTLTASGPPARPVINLDTSVALAHLLVEDRRPPVSLWNETLVASRLLEYELWTPLHARGLADSHGEAARWLIGRVAMLELVSSVPARALDAFPGSAPLRTLDALHLASCVFLVDHGQPIAFASYDRRMTAVARAMDIPVFELEGA